LANAYTVVFLGIGWYYVGIVASQVDVCKVTCQRDADVQLSDLVLRTLARDPHQAHLGLAVLVVPRLMVMVISSLDTCGSRMG